MIPILHRELQKNPGGKEENDLIQAGAKFKNTLVANDEIGNEPGHTRVAAITSLELAPCCEPGEPATNWLAVAGLQFPAALHD
jgi:hypothetical protein